MSDNEFVEETTAENEKPDLKEAEQKQTSGIIDESPEEIKRLARGMGWIDEKNFKGDPEKYVDAETYIRKTHDVNTGLRKQIKEITNVVSELKAHNEKVYRAEVKRLEKELTDLKAQRRSAIEDGDVDRVEKIEKQIDEIKEVADAQKAATEKPSGSPAWDEWLSENKWYDNDPEMRRFADETGKEYEGLPFQKILKLVRRDVEAEFPERFGKGKTKPSAPQKPAVSPVESGTRRAAAQTKTKADLSAEQRNVMNQFIRHGVMTEAEYIADLVKRGDL